jgi:hypothetical protein
MFEKGEPEEKINEVGFTKVATIEDIAKNGYVLTPKDCSQILQRAVKSRERLLGLY